MKPNKNIPIKTYSGAVLDYGPREIDFFPNGYILTPKEEYMITKKDNIIQKLPAHIIEE